MARLTCTINIGRNRRRRGGRTDNPRPTVDHLAHSNYSHRRFASRYHRSGNGRMRPRRAAIRLRPSVPDRQPGLLRGFEVSIRSPTHASPPTTLYHPLPARARWRWLVEDPWYRRSGVFSRTWQTPLRRLGVFMRHWSPDLEDLQDRAERFVLYICVRTRRDERRVPNLGSLRTDACARGRATRPSRPRRCRSSRSRTVA